ncbi:MAG: tetratricopeptide repeat protein [Anaerovibrio sp.]
MSRIKNKIANKRIKKAAETRVEAFRDLKAEMQQLMEAEDYVTAMDVMAEIAANKKIDPEVMYWGAMCYFRTGDYDRAAKWIDNVLTYDDSSRAKILLAAICIGEGREEDGLRIADAVLADDGKVADDNDNEFLQEVLEPLRYGHETLLAQYPRIKEYLAANDDIQAALEEAAGVPAVEKVAEDAEKNAATALARLRQLLEKSKKEAGESQATAKADDEQPDNKTEVSELAEEVQTTQPIQESEVAAFDVEGTVASIMSKGISLREKVRLLNVFAGACYQNGDNQSAFDLLSAALQLDCGDEATLKNIAYTCLSAGEQEQALEYAAKLPVVDFGLLYALNNK